MQRQIIAAAFRNPIGAYRFARTLRQQYVQGQALAASLPYTTARSNYTSVSHRRRTGGIVTYAEADLYLQKLATAEEFGFTYGAQRRAQSKVLNASAISVGTTGRGTRVMSRRRRYGGRKRRRFYRGRGRSAGKLALTKIRRLERKVERKNFEIPLTTVPSVGRAGAVQPLAEIVQGVGLAQRNGVSVAPTHLKINIQWIGVAASVNDVYRVIIFRDTKQVNSTTPAVTAVLRAARVMSLYAINHRSRFKILFDECFTAPGSTPVVQSWVLKLNLKLNKIMAFTTNLGTSIDKNGLYMLLISNLLTTDRPAVDFTSRCFFTDS